MTNEECVKIVDKVCAAWNQTPPMAAKKEMYLVWFTVLKDLNFHQVNLTVDDLIVEDDRFMPRPGTVRRRVCALNIEAPPEPIVAWQQMRVAAESMGAGLDGEVLHPLVRETISRLGGGSALAMHTNGDREAFFTVYKSVVAKWERENYGFSGG